MLSCTKHDVYTFLFSSSAMQSFFSFPALSLFGTQQQLTHPPVKSSTLPLRKMFVFQGVAPRHTFPTSSYVISRWDSGTAHSPSGKKLNPSSQEDARFSERCTLAYRFHFILHHSSLGLSNSHHPPVKSSTFPLRKIPVLQNVAPRHTTFIWSCVIPLWDSATGHSPSGKELKLSSLEELCFSGLIVY